MASRRMFAKAIVDSDSFLDMPLSTQALYFHLNMRADDDGFINNARKIMRMIGASDDDLRVLITKRFILTFDNGIIVIKHWRMNNIIRKDRYTETQYLSEKNSLYVKENGAYTELGNQTATTWQPLDNQSGNQMATQYSIVKYSTDKYSVVKDTSSSCCCNARARVNQAFASIWQREAMDVEVDSVLEAMEDLSLSEEMIGLAMRLAAESGKTTVAYLRGILSNLVKIGVRTPEDYAEYLEKKKEKVIEKPVETEVDVGAAEKLKALNRERKTDNG